MNKFYEKNKDNINMQSKIPMLNMSSYRRKSQNNNIRMTTTRTTMTSSKLKLYCDVILIIVGIAIVTNILPAMQHQVECAKIETQLRLLVNDDDLLFEQEKPKHASASEMSSDAELSSLDNQHENYNLYRSELKRLSYETIHRILRDENEPTYRREDAELRYYQKRSYQPTHEVLRRSVRSAERQLATSTQQNYVNLSHHNIVELNVTKDLAGIELSKIIELNLSANLLQDPLNLSMLPQLQVLDLSHNRLTALPLSENSTLISLNLNGNLIQQGVAPTNYHLLELHLSANRIENLIALNLTMLNALELLDLSCNRIETLETAFFPQRMHNLKYLNLAHNRLGTIFRETFYNLLSLNTLLLTNNNISDIDYETFLALPNLQYLDLSYNQLKGESIRALQGIPDLMALSIAYNPNVGASMQEFVASWSLKELDASGTGLCQIPAALAQSVRTLKLTNNWLKVINCGDLDSYPLLQYLDLSYSHIDDIEDDALGRLEILETVFLDHNNLRKVPVSLPTSLENIFLQNNKIMDIQIQSFQGLNNLRTLDLSGNMLLYMPALSLPKLLTLNLQSSGIKGISQSIVHTLPHLRDLLLEDNPIKCSDLLGIAEWASPCRILERSSNGELVDGITYNVDNEQSKIDGKLGYQQRGKLDLKQTFVRMHNFFVKFNGNCVHSNNRNAMREIPPSCARQANKAVGDGTDRALSDEHKTETVRSRSSFNLPIKPLKNAKTKTTTTKRKVLEFNQKNFTTEITESLQQESLNQIQATAVAETIVHTTMPSVLASRLGDTTTMKTFLQTDGGTTANVQATKTLLKSTNASASATTFPPKQQQSIEMPNSTVTSATANLSATAAITDIKFANQDEPFAQSTQTFTSATTDTTVSTTITATTTPTPTSSFSSSSPPSSSTSTRAAAINFRKHLPTTTSTQAAHNTTTAVRATHLPSTSSLNNSERISNQENVDKITSTITTTAPIVRDVATPETSSNDITITTHVPQTIPSMIKSDNNYVETTSLLRQNDFKASVVAGIVNSTIATTDKYGDKQYNYTQEDVDSTTQAKLNIYGISGQQNMNTSRHQQSERKENLILARRQQSEPLPTIGTTKMSNPTNETHRATSAKPPARKHEPLQLHIKDRHLIGTPLLMHRGENILVEANQLLLQLPSPSATTITTPTPTTTTPTTTTTTTTMRTMTTITDKINEPYKFKGNHADVLALSQQQYTLPTPLVGETVWLHDITGLTEQSTDNQAVETEAITEKTNEHNHDALPLGDKPVVKSRDTRKKMENPTEEITTTTTTTEAAIATATVSLVKNMKKHTEAKRKPSLIMKKMTITKHSNPQKQQQQPQPQEQHHHHHYALNTPRENEALTRQHVDSQQLLKEPKPTATANEHETRGVKMSQHHTAQHKHSTVNTPINDRLHEPSTFAQQRQHHEIHHYEPFVAKVSALNSSSVHGREQLSQSEQWLGIRKTTATTGHPGLVILLSLSLFMVLLVGLMHVYRCDVPWRRHLAHQQRPHQQHLNDDDVHSFLSYQQQSNQNANSNLTNKWHHSARHQPPYSSPLHNLHVRELQKTSAIEDKLKSCRQFYNASLGTQQSSNMCSTSSSSNSTDGSQTGSISSTHSSAMLDADSFYIEMTPDSGQTTGRLHSEVLPMELFGVASKGPSDRFQIGTATTTATSSPPTLPAPTTATTTTSNGTEFGGMFKRERITQVASGGDDVIKSTRKFGLW